MNEYSIVVADDAVYSFWLGADGHAYHYACTKCGRKMSAVRWEEIVLASGDAPFCPCSYSPGSLHNRPGEWMRVAGNRGDPTDLVHTRFRRPLPRYYVMPS